MKETQDLYLISMMIIIDHNFRVFTFVSDIFKECEVLFKC